MKKPLVSVIIPVFNRKKLFAEALESVLRQSFRDFELIIADDGSTEDLKSGLFPVSCFRGTEDLKAAGCLRGTEDFRAAGCLRGTEDLKASEYSGRQKDDFGAFCITSCSLDNIPLKWIRLGRHTGMAGLARNRGVDAASAAYIAFLDSDDIWEKDKLEKQFKLMQELKEQKIRIIHTREKWLRKDKIISQKSQKHKREGDIFKDALWKCIIGPSTVMLEKSLFYEAGGFREDLEVAEDYELWLKITAREKVGYIDEMLTVKRAGDWEQLSEKHGQIEIFRIDALKRLLDTDFFSEGRRIDALSIFKRKCGIYAAGCRKRGKKEEAFYYEELSKRYKAAD